MLDLKDSKDSKDSLLTEKELCARLHISLQHASRLRKKGLLGTWQKLGKSPRFDWTSVMNATKQQGAHE